jgi:hypothetical protein
MCQDRRRTAFQYVPNFQSLLKEAISEQDLITFDIQGGNENVVSRDDRHLGVIGNKKAMKELAAVVNSLVHSE